MSLARIQHLSMGLSHSIKNLSLSSLQCELRMFFFCFCFLQCRLDDLWGTYVVNRLGMMGFRQDTWKDEANLKWQGRSTCLLHLNKSSSAGESVGLARVVGT